MKYIKQVFILTAILGLTACQSRFEYGDSSQVETIHKNVDSAQLQQIVSNMVTSMMTSPSVTALTFKERPIIFVDNIKNKTLKHLDTAAITDSITQQLLASGQFRLIDLTKVDAMRKQLNYSNHIGVIDPSTAIRFGRQIGAQYMLYGNLSSTSKRISNTKEVYYKITIRLMDLDTGLIEWSDQKQIRDIN